MVTSNGSPYKNYLEAQVETASPEKLLLMLYRTAIRRCGEARRALARGDRETAHTCLLKVQSILVELMASLNLEAGGEIAKGLAGIYDYAYRKLVDANIRGRADWVEECERLLSELLSGWERALGGESENSEPAVAGAPAAPALAGLNIRG